MSFKTDTIPGEVLSLLEDVSQIVEKTGKAYLAGGTALSLFFGHRISVDLDFFTPNEFKAAPLTQILHQKGGFYPIDIKDNSIVCKISNVQFSIVYYGYPLLEPTLSYSNISIAPVRDIAAMKICAIGDRGARKDFYDIYAILKYTNLTMNQILEDVCIKFSLANDSLYHYIKALGYFEEADKEPDIQSLIKMDVSWTEIKLFFSDLIKKLLPV